MESPTILFPCEQLGRSSVETVPNLIINQAFYGISHQSCKVRMHGVCRESPIGGDVLRGLGTKLKLFGAERGMLLRRVCDPRCVIHILLVKISLVRNLN